MVRRGPGAAAQSPADASPRPSKRVRLAIKYRTPWGSCRRLIANGAERGCTGHRSIPAIDPQFANSANATDNPESPFPALPADPSHSPDMGRFREPPALEHRIGAIEKEARTLAQCLIRQPRGNGRTRQAKINESSKTF